MTTDPADPPPPAAGPHVGGAIRLRAMGSFHVGGEDVLLETGAPRMVQLTRTGQPARFDPNGTYVIGQMYVQYFLPDPARYGRPLLMWHGGGLTGACWETTPDGRPGFRDLFLRAGWDVYVSDAAERGRSGFAPVPDVWGTPISQTVETVFERFRMGEALPRGEVGRARAHAFAGTAFPVEALGRFAAQMVPRWTHTDDIILAAYIAELKAVGPAVVMAHSQGCVFALEAAARHPDLVEALVLLEPAAIPACALEAGRREVPALVVLGDYIDRNVRWSKMREDIRDFVARAPRSELLSLPEHGVNGNSHMLMMDTNSHEVARLVATWLGPRSLPAG
ncbi:MAG: alpha/beta fold hydrolase [Tropicimonas sp.]|uniref:alpha/beta fold hydrolase n=1 Tax=Tropicimonas sp. TaxID=2067044 RepID=UPI003A89861A